MRPIFSRIAVILVVLGVACGVKQDYIEGGLYSVSSENGGYAIVKVLKIDTGGVHVRLYSNIFKSRPRDVDSSKLYMVGKDVKPGEQLGMGHAPLSHVSFRAWNAEYIRTEPVREDELDGYRMWKEAKGGYF
jgi:hypothetical protein